MGAGPGQGSPRKGKCVSQPQYRSSWGENELGGGAGSRGRDSTPSTSGLMGQPAVGWLRTPLTSPSLRPHPFCHLGLRGTLDGGGGSSLQPLPSNTSTWLTWHARTSAFCGKSTRSTFGECWSGRGFPRCAGLPTMGGRVWPFRWSCHLAPAFPLHRNIATIAIFYALPVVQLVITYQTVSSGGSSLGCAERWAPLCHRLDRPKCRASQPGAVEQAQV